MKQEITLTVITILLLNCAVLALARIESGLSVYEKNYEGKICKHGIHIKEFNDLGNTDNGSFDKKKVTKTESDIKIVAVSGLLGFNRNTKPTDNNKSKGLPVEMNYSLSVVSGAYNITTVVTGGVSPYTFHWNTGDTTQNLFGVPQGIYTLEIADSDGQNASFNVVAQLSYPIIWTDLENMETSGDTLIPTDSLSGGLYGAASLNKIDGNADGGIQYTINQLSPVYMPGFMAFGLSNTNTNSDISDIEYAFCIEYLNPINQYDTILKISSKIIESGIVVPDIKIQVNPGDRYEILRTGNTINYLVNNVIVYQTITDATKSLIADVVQIPMKLTM